MSSAAGDSSCPDLSGEYTRIFDRVHAATFFKKLADLGIGVQNADAAAELLSVDVQEVGPHFQELILMAMEHRPPPSNVVADIKALAAELADDPDLYHAIVLLKSLAPEADSTGPGS